MGATQNMRRVSCRDEQSPILTITQYLRTKNQSLSQDILHEYNAYLFEEVNELGETKLTHHLSKENGWQEFDGKIPEHLMYLGVCDFDGDMFMSREIDRDGRIIVTGIYKGQLNSGYYTHE